MNADEYQAVKAKVTLCSYTPKPIFNQSSFQAHINYTKESK